MEEYNERLEKAKRYVRSSYHVLEVTYPIIKDPKLLLAVAENIFLSYTNGMTAILELEAKYKRIPPFRDEFNSKFNLFRSRIADKYNINKRHLSNLQEIKELLMMHKESPIEFRRNDRFFICRGDFSYKALSVEGLRLFHKDAKEFVNKVGVVMEGNERLYRRGTGRDQAR